MLTIPRSENMENDAYLIVKNGGANFGWYKLQRELPQSKIKKGYGK